MPDERSAGLVRDTIFAPASGQGSAAIAIIRVSGPRSDEVLRAISDRELPTVGRAAVRVIGDAWSGPVDEALVLTFAAGTGYTGEPAFEIQCHGGRAVVLAILELLGRQPGCRIAAPGEFTRRAVEAGRMDLLSAEAVGDLISAETEVQRRQAMRSLGGELRGLVNLWRERLIRALALIEVTIDWVDEEVPEEVFPEVRALIAEVTEGVSAQLSLSRRASRMRLGFEVALVGRPNTGKSSLLNALAGREAAIASEHAGTTRDVIEVRYDLAGLPLIFLDMAGLRETQDPVEALGVSRARARAEAADLRVFLTCGDVEAALPDTDLFQDGDLRVWSKTDLATGQGDISVSAKTGQGIEELLDMIRGRLTTYEKDFGLVAHARQRACLEKAIVELANVEQELEGGETELVAEALRQSVNALDSLIGRVDVDDVLDQVFASFCLGK